MLIQSILTQTNGCLSITIAHFCGKYINFIFWKIIIELTTEYDNQ